MERQNIIIIIERNDAFCENAEYAGSDKRISNKVEAFFFCLPDNQDEENHYDISCEQERNAKLYAPVDIAVKRVQEDRKNGGGRKTSE